MTGVGLSEINAVIDRIDKRIDDNRRARPEGYDQIERALFRERGLAQMARDERRIADMSRNARRPKMKRCPTCKHER